MFPIPHFLNPSITKKTKTLQKRQKQPVQKFHTVGLFCHWNKVLVFFPCFFDLNIERKVLLVSSEKFFEAKLGVRQKLVGKNWLIKYL